MNFGCCQLKKQDFVIYYFKQDLEKDNAMNFLKKLFSKKQDALTSKSNIRPEHVSMQITIPSIKTLRKQLKDSDLQLRARAADRLGQTGDLRSIPWLVEAIRDEYIQRHEFADVYRAEIQSAGGFTPTGGSDTLRRHGDAIMLAEVASTAERALIGFGPSAVEPIIASLIATARSKDWHVRSALGHDSDWQVRRALGDILGRVLQVIGKLQAVNPLLAALKDRNKDVRYTVAVALGSLGNVQAVDPLTTALNDKASEVCTAAKEALEKLSKQGV